MFGSLVQLFPECESKGVVIKISTTVPLMTAWVFKFLVYHENEFNGQVIPC